MFGIIFSQQAAKFLRQAEKTLARRIAQKLERLKTEPIIHDSKKIVGKDRRFRVRVGDYRILYVIVLESQQILIERIDKRSRVYQ